MEPTLFEERQHFRQPWIYLLLGGLIVMMMFFVQMRPDWALLSAIASVALIMLMMLKLELHVRITADSIHIRFFPFLRKQIPLTTIVSFESRTYRPIREYGGWGIRYSFGNGWAYNVSGNRGVQLH